MTTWMARGLRAMMALVLAAGLAFGPAVAGAAAYVGAALGDVKAEDKAKVGSPQPVQLIFQFKTKGAPNAQATKFLKADVTKIVTESGYFSSVSEAPVASGAVLSVVIDNVVSPEEIRKAEAQGAKTGATLFIAGSNVTDHYQSTLDYVASPTAAKITRTAEHSVILQMGMINKPPENAVKIGSMKDAILTMTRQIILNPLNEIAKDPGFTAAAAPSPAAPADGAAAPADAAPPPPAAQPAPPQPATEPATPKAA